MRKAFIVCILLCTGGLFTGLPVLAQSYEAIILDKEKGAPVAGVLILQVNNGYQFQSNTAGRFRIKAASGDTLLYSHMGYETLRRAVPSKATDTVWLTPKSYTLKEVEITTPMARFKADSTLNHTLYRKTLEDAHYTPSLGAGIGGASLDGGVSWLALKLSGKDKRNKQFTNEMLLNEKERFVAARYTVAAVISVTGLSAENAKVFIVENPMEYLFARAASELEFKMWIRTHFRAWRAKQVLPSDSTKTH